MSIRRRRLLIATAAVMAVTVIASFFFYSPDPAVSRLLLQFWAARPAPCVTDLGFTPRCHVVKRLRNLPGDAPRSAILRLLRWHRMVGPRLVHGRATWDAEYGWVMQEGLAGLTRWPDDPAVLRLARNLVEAERRYPRVSWPEPVSAHRVLILHDMHLRGVDSDDKAIEYLVNQLTGMGEGHMSDWAKPGLLTEASARNVAIGQLLEEYGKAALPSLRLALKQPANDAERQEALRYTIRVIGLRSEFQRRNHRRLPPLDRGLRR